MDNVNWMKYVSSCYDLVLEGEEEVQLQLNMNVQAHVVHLMAKNMENFFVTGEPIAIKFLEAMNIKKNKDDFVIIGDECLLIHSFPIKYSKWPNPHYYKDMGITSYEMADHIMANHFENAGRVLSAVFNRKYFS